MTRLVVSAVCVVAMPAVVTRGATETAGGRVHVTYTHRCQRSKHVVIDPAKLAPEPIVDGKWPD